MYSDTSDSEDGSEVEVEEVVEANSESESDSVLDSSSEEDSEEEQQQASKRRRVAPDVLPFLQLEAEVDHDEEEDEEEYSDMEDLIANDEEMAEVMQKQYDDRRAARTANFDRFETDDIAAMAAELEERYRGYDKNVEFDDNEERTDITQQGNLPTVGDAKLWLVRCKPGKEREAVCCLMQKYFNLKEQDGPQVQIKSAICCDDMKGFIYIEAHKDVHVTQAISGLRILNGWKMKLVPIKEMTSVLRVVKKNVELKRDGWVRVKRGTYRNDIGQIQEIDQQRRRVVVKLIPRLDFSVLKSTDEPSDGKRKRGRAQRPPQRFFNVTEVRHLGGEECVESHGRDGTYIYDKQKFKDGYLYKSMNIKSLDVENVVPTLDDIQKFQEKGEDGEEDGILNNLAALRNVRKRKVIFAKGDTVKVIDGDLKHLMGVVDSVNDDMVSIMPKHEDLNDLLTFKADKLAKYFKIGDHVKVISGKYKGETGLILRVDNNIVTLLSDLTKKEMRVLAQDIKKAAEVASGQMRLGNYELHDLVQLDTSTVGVIVKVERDSFKILDTNGHTRSVRLQEVGNKRNSRNAIAFDKHSNPIGTADVLQVIDGPHKGKQGTVRHIYRYFAFLHSNEMLDNTGIFVVRTNNASLLGGGRGKKGNRGYDRPRGGRTRFRGRMRGGRGGGYGRGRRSVFLNKTVRIISNPWKGYIGIVKDENEIHARVELHTNCKIVNIPIENLVEIDSEGSSVAPPTPSIDLHEGLQTPMRASTPMRIGTPTHDAWNPHQPNTPMRDSWEDELSPEMTDYSNTIASGFNPTSPAYGEIRNDDVSLPNTPSESSMYSPNTPTTYQPGFTPDAYSESQGTPRHYSNTPQGYPTTPATPGAMGMIPQTPGTPGMGNIGLGLGFNRAPTTPVGADGGLSYDSPASPALTDSNGSVVDMSDSWLALDIEVRVTSNTFMGGVYYNTTGVIQEVSESGCRVRMDKDNELVVIPPDYIEPSVPGKKDRIRIIRGEFKGATGELMGIDGADGIVKMENYDIKILHLQHLARFRPEASLSK